MKNKFLKLCFFSNLELNYKKNDKKDIDNRGTPKSNAPTQSTSHQVWYIWE